jgi:DNA-binding GntR family transcriptional regulator
MEKSSSGFASMVRAELAVPPLPVRVAEHLRDGIRRQVWNPGDQIIESRLAKELGVGQHVVREALQQLEFEGYVKKIPNRGNFVMEMTREDVAQLFDFRMEMESLAARWAREKGRPAPEDETELEQALALLETRAQDGDYPRFQEADLAFHIRMWELAGNRHLTKALETATRPQFMFVLLRRSGQTRLDLIAVAEEHREWLNWMRSASPEDAARRTRDVLRSFKQQVMDTWDG